MDIEKSNREELSLEPVIEQPSAEDAGTLESKEETMDSEMPNWFEL